MYTSGQILKLWLLQLSAEPNFNIKGILKKNESFASRRLNYKNPVATHTVKNMKNNGAMSISTSCDKWVPMIIRIVMKDKKIPSSYWRFLSYRSWLLLLLYFLIRVCNWNNGDKHRHSGEGGSEEDEDPLTVDTTTFAAFFAVQWRVSVYLFYLFIYLFIII